MSVQILKLVTGEEIIADVQNQHNNQGVTVENPALIQLGMDQQGNMGVSLFPFMLFAGTRKFNIDNDHIMITIESHEIEKELINRYNQQFGSGIVLP